MLNIIHIKLNYQLTILFINLMTTVIVEIGHDKSEMTAKYNIVPLRHYIIPHKKKGYIFMKKKKKHFIDYKNNDPLLYFVPSGKFERIFSEQLCCENVKTSYLMENCLPKILYLSKKKLIDMFSECELGLFVTYEWYVYDYEYRGSCYNVIGRLKNGLFFSYVVDDFTCSSCGYFPNNNKFSICLSANFLILIHNLKLEKYMNHVVKINMIFLANLSNLLTNKIFKYAQLFFD